MAVTILTIDHIEKGRDGGACCRKRLRRQLTSMFNSPEFQALRREYLQTVVERVAYLRGEVQKLRSADPVDLKQLRQEIHKSRGSGGFYGFAQLSQASGTAEDQLVLTIDGEIDRDDQRLADLVDGVIAAAEAAAAELGL